MCVCVCVCVYRERKRDREVVCACIHSYKERERARAANLEPGALLVKLVCTTSKASKARQYEQRTWSVARNCSFSSLYTNKSPPSKAAESTPPEAVKTKKKRFVLVRLSKAFYVCTPEAVKKKKTSPRRPRLSKQKKKRFVCTGKA